MVEVINDIYAQLEPHMVLHRDKELLFNSDQFFLIMTGLLLKHYIHCRMLVSHQIARKSIDSFLTQMPKIMDAEDKQPEWQQKTPGDGN